LEGDDDQEPNGCRDRDIPARWAFLPRLALTCARNGGVHGFAFVDVAFWPRGNLGRNATYAVTVALADH
jgi:hypothetical protein